MPFRSGFGMTTLTQSASEDSQQFLRACNELLESLGITKLDVLTDQTGSICGTRFTASYREKVKKLSCICPVLPLTDTKYFESIAPQQRHLYYVAKHAPQIMPLVMRAMVAKCDYGYDEEWILNHFQESPIDLALMSVDESKFLCREAFANIYLQGVEGMVREFNATGEDWGGIFAEKLPPIAIFVGKHNTQFRSEMLIDYFGKQTQQSITIKEVENAAYFTFPQQPKVIFDALCTI